MRTTDDTTQELQRHLTAELYAHTRRGERAPGVFARLLHDHLVERCPHCSVEWERLGGDRAAFHRLLAALEPAAPPPAAAPPPGYHAPDSAEQKHLDATVERLVRQRALAIRELRLLRQTPAAQRADKLARARSRYASRMLAEMLLAEARRRVRDEAAEAESLAALVPAVLARVEGAEGAPWAAALAARAAAQRGNALRVAGDLPAADRAFAELRLKLAGPPLADPAAAAEVASLEASLRIDQRSLGEAERLLDRVVLLYERAGDEEGKARALVQQGMLLETAGRPEEAVERLEEAARRLDPERHRPLLIGTVTGRVVALCALGRHAEAGHLLDGSLDLYEASEELQAGATFRGLQARVALGLGRHDEAADAYLACRDGYLALGRTYDAALASLDLAEVYLAAGRTAELRKLAAQLVPQFRTRGVGREALAALVLFARAVQADEVTAKVIAEARRRFKATPR